MSEYRPGDKVVLPPYGVGVVAGIAQRSVAGSDKSYYQVDFPGTRSKAYVPVEAPQTTRLRRALSPDQVNEILALLQEGRLPLPRQWAARHRKTTEILADGDPFRIATLAGQLRAWEQEKAFLISTAKPFAGPCTFWQRKFHRCWRLPLTKPANSLKKLWARA